MFFNIVFVILIVPDLYFGIGTEEGETCFKDGLAGICTNARICQTALKEIKMKGYPQICGFVGKDPIVCCFDQLQLTTSTSTTTPEPPTPEPPTPEPPTPEPPTPEPPTTITIPPEPLTTITTTTTPEPVKITTITPTTTTPEPEPELDQRQGTENTTSESVTPEVAEIENEIQNITRIDVTEEECPSELSTRNTGRKAYDKCIEYQEQLLYPCELVDDEGNLERSDYCPRSALPIEAGRKPSATQEYTHLVMLGYGNDTNAISWLCSGSIISEKYVLTSATCATSRELGEVQYVLVGGLLWESEGSKNITELYRVKRVVRNPGYEAPVLYHDIALLELETKLKLSPLLLPACLHTGTRVEDETGLYTTRAYSTDNAAGDPDVLDKVSLEKLSHENCSSRYPRFPLLKEGVDSKTQICYINEDADSCLGDKGNPIQVDNPEANCMYLILGVTSFRTCDSSPGLFTRIAAYVPWIESVVWPEEPPSNDI